MTRSSRSSTSISVLLAIGFAATFMVAVLGLIGTAAPAQAVQLTALTGFDTSTEDADLSIGNSADRAPREALDSPAAWEPPLPISAPRDPNTKAITLNPDEEFLPESLAQLLHERSAFPSTPIPGFDASETVATGLADNHTIYNGDRITYTLILTNTGLVPLTDLVLLDFLPDAVLNVQVLNEDTIGIDCDTAVSTCDKGQVGQQFPEPLGGLITVTSTRWITWRIPILTPTVSTRLVISGVVEGQADGISFTNRAFVDFKQGGDPQAYTFDEVATIARVRVSDGGSSISQTPNWFSSDFGGTISQDWGDFDRDGQLDLALGSSLGPSVYHNVNGRLQKFAGLASTSPAYGVRWADLNGDGRLELIAVGDSLDGTPSGAGINRIYTLVGNVFSQTSVFTSDYQLVRVVGANLDHSVTGTIDLIASTNAINPPCPVQRYKNDGAGNFTPAECISTAATAAIAIGDFNNDDYPDLVLGRFPNAVRLLINHNGVLTETNSVNFDTSPFLPYDFTWGDYDGDGFLDLAAAFPLQRQARIYHNEVGSGGARPFRLAGILSTRRFMTPLAVDWGDFNGDGALDLAVADDPPKVYINQNQLVNARSGFLEAGAVRAHGQVWSARAVALDNTNLNLSLSNQNGPSLLFEMIASHLQTTLTPITGAAPANSVAWGDANRDGQIDLLMGAGANNVPSKIYYNANGIFTIDNSRSFFPSGFGPHSTAYGDFNGDGYLEGIIGTGNSRFVDAYLISNTLTRVWTTPVPQPVNVVSLGDMNDDGYLDLLVGTRNGPVYVYRNNFGALEKTPIFATTATGNARSVAWADMNGDRYMDFAVGSYDGYTRIYANNHNETFTPIFTSTFMSKTTSLSWGDFNLDGYPDLAVGTYGQGNIIYQNNAGKFATTPVWTSPVMSKTTSVAWGDWDNDGQLDLAVGNDGEPNQVYANLGSLFGAPRLFALWQSADVYSTTEVAWGDMNNDGFLELAVSRQSGPSGVYHNTTIGPSHLRDVFTPTLLLPLHPSYVSIARPGRTSDAYLYSSSELLSGVFAPTVTVHYKAYNPNGTRALGGTHAAGSPITNTVFDYSVDGGTTWKPASTFVTAPLPITQTTRLGQAGTFVWNAQGDKAIGDQALFRVRVVEQNPIGPVQRAASVAVSPPFRVRGLTCVWPANPSFVTDPVIIPDNKKPVNFIGTIREGSGAMVYAWKFGDNTPLQYGQKVTHTFALQKYYNVTMWVTGPACPIARPVTITRRVPVGVKTYLPMMRKGAVAYQQKPSFDSITHALEQAASRPPDRSSRPSAPRALTLPLRAATVITWTPNLPNQLTNGVIGYNSQPAINLTGTRVAFWSTADFANNGPNRNPDGNVELFYARIDQVTGQVTFTQLTSSTGSILGGFNFAPSIDDQGDHVAFFSDRDLKGQNPRHNFQIFLAHIDDNDQFTITQVTIPPDPTITGINVFPSISADGRRIAFVSDLDLTNFRTNLDGNQEIFVVDLDANGQPLGYTQITRTPDDVLNDQPALDADGGHIAFISDQHGALTPGGIGSLYNPDRNQEIVVADMHSGSSVTFTQITSTTEDIVNDHPRLASDSTHNVTITYVSGDNVNRTVKAARVDELGSLTSIPVAGGDSEQPALNTGDGSRIIAVSPDGQQVKFLDVVNLDATSIASAPDANHTSPAISSNGMNIAYVSNRQIYVMYSPIANLGVAKAVDKPTVGQGDSLLYTIMVTSSGPVTAPNVILTDTLPDNLLPLDPPGDQTDDNNDGSGFGGILGSNNIEWDANGFVRLGLTIPDPQSELPDGSSTSGWFDMSSNVLMMHLNDLNPSAGIDDTSFPNNNGTCLTPCPTRVNGKLDHALHFNGLTNTVQVANSPSLNFDQNNSFTIIAWANSAAVGTPQILLSKHPIPGQGYLLYQNYTGAASIYLNGSTRVTGGAIADGKWHQVAAVINRATNDVTLYVDGVSVGRAAFSGSVDNGADLAIGSWLGSYYYAGDIDEVAIFGRALSASELEMIYNWQTPVFRTGYFNSRVFDGYFPTSWNRLSWVTDRPVDKELPDGGLPEQGYTTGPADMTGNVLLMHLNEPAGSLSFADGSGRNNNGACSGANCPALGARGKYNTAGSFANSVIKVTSNDSLNPIAQVTLEAWVYLTNAAADQKIVGKTQIGNGYLLGVTNGQIYPEIWDEVGGRHTFQAGAISSNRWTHLAVTWRNNGYMIAYIDGAEAGRQWVGYVNVGISYGLLMIGAAPWNGASYAVNGLIDEVAVYNRELSPGEISDHYQRGLTRLKFQVRSCVSSTCNDVNNPFVGPNGSGTFFSELTNPTIYTPTITITVPPKEYFQYRAYFESDKPPATPALRSVTIGPPHIKASPSIGECSGAQIIICKLGDMARDAVATIFIKVNTRSNAGGLINNLAEVSSSAVDHTPNDNRSTATTDVSARVNLSITQNLPTASVVAGNHLTYTFLVTNSGPNAADNLVISATLPPSVTLDSTPTPSIGGLCDFPPSISCVFPSLPANSPTPASITFAATVDQNKSGTIQTWASTAANQTDELPTNNIITITTSVRREADLSLDKAVEAPPIMAGTRITYDLTLHNGGPSSANNIRITDTLPAGMTYAGGFGCTGSPASDTVTCDVAGPLDALIGIARVNVSVNVSPEVRGTLTNTATATSDETDPNPGNENASNASAVQARADLTINKSVIPTTPVNAGDVLTYTIDVGNTGPSSALAAQVTDVLTRGLALKSTTPACASTPITIGHGHKAYQVTQLDCAVGRIDPAQHAFVTIAATVTNRADAVIVNTASVTATEAPAIEQSTITSNAGANAALRITKSAQPEPAIAGQSITYTIFITNDGPFVAYDVVVTDALPISITFASDLGSTPALSATIDTSAAASGLITWTIPAMDLNEHGTLTFTADIDPVVAAGRVKTNRAGIDSSTPHPPVTPGTFDSHIQALADLDITKSARPAPVIAGQNLTYTIIVTNNGPSLARVITVTDVLDSNTQYRSGVPNCSPASSTVTCVSNNLYPINADTFTIVVTVTSGTISGTNVTNSASVTATESPAVMTSNTTSTPITSSADVLITKTRTPTGNLPINAVVTYTLDYSNNGASTAQGVFVTDTLPFSLTYHGVVNTNPLLPPPSVTLPNITWDVGLLGPGARGTIVFTATVNSGAIGATIVNTGTIKSSTFDPDPNNNQRTNNATIAALLHWLAAVIEQLM